MQVRLPIGYWSVLSETAHHPAHDRYVRIRGGSKWIAKALEWGRYHGIKVGFDSAITIYAITM